MKRLTALVLAGVLVFGTSCGGGNQTNSGEAQEGATAHEQTADGAEVTTDGATDSSAEYADDEQGDAGKVAAVVSEGKYAMSLKLMNGEEDIANYLYSENGWESISGEELSEKLDEVDEEYIIEAGSGERLELKDPEW